MNVVREINKINERELNLGTSGASWHDDYKDSAYIFIGGLHLELTEGDVITIFSQYGEVMDVNLPRDKETGKTKGFGFLMYEDQRSTVLAVDNLNGAKVLERTLRVDHVKNYKQPKVKGEDGEWEDREEQSLNAKPEMIVDEGSESESSEDAGPVIDPEDPMAAYLLEKRREEKAKKKAKKGKGKSKDKDETPEERRARKARKREKKAAKSGKKSEGLKGVEALLKSWGGDTGIGIKRPRSPEGQLERERSRRRSASPDPQRGKEQRENDDWRRERTQDRGSLRRRNSRSRTPVLRREEDNSHRSERDLRYSDRTTYDIRDRGGNKSRDRSNDRRGHGNDDNNYSHRRHNR